MSKQLPEGATVAVEPAVGPGLFAPERLPPRCEYGYTMHPDIPKPAEEESWEAMVEACAALGWEADYVPGDEIVLEETGEYDATTWEPTPPDGAGWRLVAIYDTEDGPCAMFVRPLMTVQACRPEDRAMLATPAGQDLLRCAAVALRDLPDDPHDVRPNANYTS